MSKDGKEQAKNSHLAEGIEGVYSRRRIRRFKIMLNMKGDFFFLGRNAIYSIKFQRSWPGDMIGIYMEES